MIASVFQHWTQHVRWKLNRYPRSFEPLNGANPPWLRKKKVYRKSPKKAMRTQSHPKAADHHTWACQCLMRRLQFRPLEQRATETPKVIQGAVVTSRHVIPPCPSVSPGSFVELALKSHKSRDELFHARVFDIAHLPVNTGGGGGEGGGGGGGGGRGGGGGESGNHW